MTDLKKLRELAEATINRREVGFECDDPYDTYPEDLFDAATMPENIIALLDRLEAAERDAKRLDWLLTNAHLGIGQWGMDWELAVMDVPIPAPDKHQIRQWIDAAMKEQA